MLLVNIERKSLLLFSSLSLKLVTVNPFVFLIQSFSCTSFDLFTLIRLIVLCSSQHFGCCHHCKQVCMWQVPSLLANGEEWYICKQFYTNIPYTVYYRSIIVQNYYRTITSCFSVTALTVYIFLVFSSIRMLIIVNKTSTCRQCIHSQTYTLC